MNFVEIIPQKTDVYIWDTRVNKSKVINICPLFITNYTTNKQAGYEYRDFTV